MSTRGSKGLETELVKGQFFCPKCNMLRSYTYRQVSTLFRPYFIPLFEARNLGEVVECQVCGNGFDPKVLEAGHQSALKLVAATRYELLHGTSPLEAKCWLESVGLREEIAESVIQMAQG